MKSRNKVSARKIRQQERRRNSGVLDHVPVDASRLNLVEEYFEWFAKLLPVVYEKGKYYYEDKPFICKDCGASCVWRAKDQKWWYETMRKSMDTTAVRCLACRVKERRRKVEVRRVSEEGKQRKLARLAALKNNIPE
ncbi:MAG: zinc-ribbon domain-containing protein [Betaproteobacteria bacterium]|nr:zinc-ribbon domain-containing protein [Betaproteobacteria bacterium]MCL2885256.1 zinc-ribbon domain-containing protein [Betaproteobacteria bacterium]